MERMQTRERKPRTISDFSPPSSQTLKKTNKKKSQSNSKSNKQKTKTTNEKNKTDNEKNKTENEKNKPNNEKSKSKTKPESEKNLKTIEFNTNSKKEETQSRPTKNKKKKSNNPSSSSSSIIIPDKLKVYVSQEIWNSWSNIRRDSFKQIIKNPNSFFYRNRPPGDPQKFGPFTTAEEKLFIERLKYFRDELGVNDGLWGYFSVPILGRVGYQCSNFYRSLILSGKIIDSSYELMPDGKLHYLHGGNKIGGSKPPQKVMKILEDEAFTFIKKCFDNAKDGEVPQVLKPITVKQEPKKKQDKTDTSDSDARNEYESDSEKEGIFIEIGKSYTHQNQNQNFNIKFNTFALDNGKKRTSFDANNQNWFNPNGSARKTRKSSFQEKSLIGSKGSNRNGRNKSSYGLSHYSNNSDILCPLVGAIDPFSNLPMDRPMMDAKGIVMDRSSWKKIFSTKDLPPFDIAGFSMNDLIELNSQNFDEYRYYITNFVC